MNERPILFSWPMVSAIIEGRKTMTRRVVRIAPEEAEVHEGNEGTVHAVTDLGCHVTERVIKCPYGKPGDRLWVRETWAINPDDRGAVYRATDPDWETCEGRAWKPSIFMPRWASRLTLEVAAVRVERLQEISRRDAIEEGCVGSGFDDETPQEEFAELWDSINAGRVERLPNGTTRPMRVAWDDNPWVWVIEFKRIEQEATQ